MTKAKGPTFVLRFRRRREGLTNYTRRLALVKSRLPRLVIRSSNRQILAQLISFDTKGDKVVSFASSKDLSKYGWVPKRNSPTAYLTGLLCGLRGKKKGVEGFVLDSGLGTPSKNSLMFVGMKGAIDAGLEAQYDESILEEGRVTGKHIAEYAKMLKEKDMAEYSKRFSEYIRNKADPAKIEEMFAAAKQKVLQEK